MRVEPKLLHNGERVIREEGVAGAYYLVNLIVLPIAFWLMYAIAAFIFAMVGRLTAPVDALLGGGTNPVLAIFGLFGPLLLLLAVFYISRELLRLYGFGYALTDQRLIIREGVIARRSKSTDLARMQDVSVHQDLICRLLGYGNVIVETAGTEGSLTLYRVAKPYDWVEQMRSVAAAAGSSFGTNGASGPPSVAPASMPSADLLQPVVAGGWHVDPYGRHQLRYYDGARWTEHVQNSGTPSIDSLPA